MFEQAEQEMRPSRINLVQEAGLSQLTSLDILALNMEEPGVPYTKIITIDDQQSLREIVEALDADIKPDLAVACIPIHQLHFHLQDSSLQRFAFSCGDDQATFLRGDQPFIDGRDFRPPADFNELMLSHIHSTWCQHINPARDLELSQTIHLEVMETVFTDVDSADANVFSARVEPRLNTDDTKLIAPLLAALGVDHDFTDADPCAMRYGLQFTMADGTAESIGYICRDDDSPVLRGDSEIWHGRFIQASSQFQEQFERLMNQP